MRRRGSRRGGLGSEAGGRSGGWGGRATERKDGRDGRAGLEKLEKVPPRPGPGPSRVRSVFLPPGQPKGRSVKVPARRSFSPGGSLHPFFLLPLSSPSFPPHPSGASYPSGTSTPPAPRPSILRSGAAGAAGAAIRPLGVELPEPRGGTGFRVRSGELPPRRGLRCRGLRVAGRSRRRADRPPGKGREASRKREKTKSRKGFSSRRGRKRRSGRAAKGRPVEQCRRTEVKWSSGAAVKRCRVNVGKRQRSFGTTEKRYSGKAGRQCCGTAGKRRSDANKTVQR